MSGNYIFVEITGLCFACVWLKYQNLLTHESELSSWGASSERTVINYSVACQYVVQAGKCTFMALRQLLAQNHELPCLCITL